MLYLDHLTQPSQHPCEGRMAISPFTKEKVRSGRLRWLPHCSMAGEWESGFKTWPVCRQNCTLMTMLYWSLAKWLEFPLRTHHFSFEAPRDSHMCSSATTTDLFSFLAFALCPLITPGFTRRLPDSIGVSSPGWRCCLYRCLRAGSVMLPHWTPTVLPNGHCSLPD